MLSIHHRSEALMYVCTNKLYERRILSHFEMAYLNHYSQVQDGTPNKAEYNMFITLIIKEVGVFVLIKKKGNERSNLWGYAD